LAGWSGLPALRWRGAGRGGSRQGGRPSKAGCDRSREEEARRKRRVSGRGRRRGRDQAAKVDLARLDNHASPVVHG